MSTIRENSSSGDPTDNRRCFTSRVGSVKLASGHVNADHWAAHAKSTTSEGSRLKGRSSYRFATWNVRGLLHTGKLDILSKELLRCDIAIAGISETHWHGKGHFCHQNYTVYYSGNDDISRNGVALLVTNKINNSVLGYSTINDRIILVRINAKPCTLNIIQIYAPTATSTEEEIEDFYTSLEATLEKIPNRECTIVMGDFNAKVGSSNTDEHLRNVIGRHGIGDRNERGEKLIQFCLNNNLTIANTLFQQHVRRIYTWTSPNGRTKNQIDYILIQNRWRSSAKVVKTLPGADCNSDHKLLMITYRLKMKVCRRPALENKLPPIINKVALSDMVEQSLTINITSREGPNELWQKMKQIVTKSVVDTQQPLDNSKKRPWISTVTLETVEARRKLYAAGLKIQDTIGEYKRLSNTIQQQCRRDKNEYLNKMCREIQEHANCLQTRDIFLKIKQITRKFKSHTWSIYDENEILTSDLDKVMDVWRRYCERLYSEEDNVTDVVALVNEDHKIEEPSILLGEVEAAIEKLAGNKSPGIDLIPAEIFKALGEGGVKLVHLICEKIWQTLEWPLEWTTSVIIPLHKKGSTSKCENYRLIALITHVSKIMLYIIHGRLQPYINWQLSPEQAGFVKGRGTREQILNLRQLIEKTREYYVPTYLCFVDYEKAFDNVKWHLLWPIMTSMGVPLHLVRLIKSLYDNSTALVRIDNTISSKCQIKKGVRQGCILSPILFNLYTEYIMRYVLENWKGGVSIGGKKISNLRYADDTLVIAQDQEELITLLERLERHSKQHGLKINIKKTKVMIIDREHNNRPDIHQIGRYDVVDKFIYLGALINNQGCCEAEIRRRIQLGRTAMTQLTRIWKNPHLTRNTKINLVQSLVFPVFNYACETWTLRAADRKRVDAFELWCWRRLLRIPWTAKRSNVSVLADIKPNQRLSSSVYSRILKFFGHITRSDNMEKLMVQGKPNGKRRRGRSPSRWIDTVETLLGTNVEGAVGVARSRQRWRTTVRHILQNLESD